MVLGKQLFLLPGLQFHRDEQDNQIQVHLVARELPDNQSPEITRQGLLSHLDERVLF